MWHGVMPPAVPAFGYHCGETFVQHYMDGCEGQYWAEIKDSVPVACGDPPLRQRHFVQQEPTMQFHEDGLLQTQHQEPRKWEEDQFRQQQAQLKKEQAASMKQREVLEQKEQELQIEAERLKQEWKLVKKAKDELLQFEKKTMQQLNRERLEMRQREVLLQERAQEQETHFANVRRGMKEKEADFKCRLARVTERELEVTFREVTLEGKVEPKPTATASTSVGSQQSSKKELWRLGKGETSGMDVRTLQGGKGETLHSGVRTVENAGNAREWPGQRNGMRLEAVRISSEPHLSTRRPSNSRLPTVKTAD